MLEEKKIIPQSDVVFIFGDFSDLIAVHTKLLDLFNLGVGIGCVEYTYIILR